MTLHLRACTPTDMRSTIVSITIINRRCSRLAGRHLGRTLPRERRSCPTARPDRRPLSASRAPSARTSTGESRTVHAALCSMSVVQVPILATYRHSGPG